MVFFFRELVVRQTGDLLKVYPASHPESAGMCFRVGGKKWMDGCLPDICVCYCCRSYQRKTIIQSNLPFTKLEEDFTDQLISV